MKADIHVYLLHKFSVTVHKSQNLLEIYISVTVTQTVFIFHSNFLICFWSYAMLLHHENYLTEIPKGAPD